MPGARMDTMTPYAKRLAIACIFPGQGSQYPGMGKDLAENFAASRQVFEEVDDALGFSLSRLCFEGPAEELQLTENTQPAILSVSVAAFRAMEANGFPQPQFVAGHSLGEYSALVAADVLDLSDAVKTVRARGRYMQEAVPVGVGAMAAVMGAALKDIEGVCEAVRGKEVCSPANINAANQVVIAGHASAVDRAMEAMREIGAKRVVKLNVSAPFHCALMRPAQDRLSVDLQQLVFTDARMPVVTNVDASPLRDGATLRQSLVEQVASPVRWLDSMKLLINHGVGIFVEVGPGKVLSGLVRQISREVNSFNVDDAASLETTLNRVTADS
jgi:[acyl-carrier-protein] S-malonyltransferase